MEHTIGSFQGLRSTLRYPQPSRVPIRQPHDLVTTNWACREKREGKRNARGEAGSLPRIAARPLAVLVTCCADNVLSLLTQRYCNVMYFQTLR